MRHSIPIIVLAVIGVCVAPADAQRRAAPGSLVEKKARDTKRHAASLLRIAERLRQSGQNDVAAKIEAQARRLLPPSKKRDPVSRAGRNQASARADAVDPRRLPKAKRRRTRGSRDSRKPRAVRPRPARPADPVKAARPAQPARPAKPAKPTKTSLRNWLVSNAREWTGTIEVKAPKVRVPKAKAPKVKAPRVRVPKAKAPNVGVPRVKAPKTRGWVVDPAARNRWETAPKARPTRARRSARLPSGLPNTWRETRLVVPGGLLTRDDARVDTGRNRFREVPIATGRDAKGQVTWLGLPSRPRMAEPVPDPVEPVVTESRGDLERRVEALSSEVRAMRAVLERLTERLTKDRKKRLIR